jgi:hypothetical protein
MRALGATAADIFLHVVSEATMLALARDALPDYVFPGRYRGKSAGSPA